ncbi:MAG TPA: hypothetical protein VKX46_04165, partial [Ktedonobacteraceae bacterium]|nr:hypothetical protein [Ktedonobacteraceae bacterium]
MKNGQSLLEPLSTTRERSQAQQPVKTERSKRRRGITWVLGSFLFCPCHLPITLGILAAVFGGTALGAFFIRYSIIAGVII